MRILFDTWKHTGRLHHGYCIPGDASMIIPALHAFLEKEVSFFLQGNPDYIHLKSDVFSIDDSRALKELHASKPMGERRVVIIEARSFTHEAQNSLLKIFEEPGERNHFFLILPTATVLLPTLISRLSIISPATTESDTSIASLFLSQTPAERLEHIKQLLDDEDGVKERANQLCRHILAELRKRPNTAAALKDVLTVSSYINDRSSSVKMILEHIAVTLPIYA